MQSLYRQPPPTVDQRPTISLHQLGSALLIFAGVVLICNRLAWASVAQTWWANFIYIPALLLLWSMIIATTGQHGRWRLVAILCAGCFGIVFTVATVLLFHAISIGWPLFIMIVGVTMLALGRETAAQTLTIPTAAWARVGMWVGATTALLGVAFLVITLLPSTLLAALGTMQWWSFCILMAAYGFFDSAYWLHQRGERRPSGHVLLLSGIGVLLTVLGILEIYNLL